MKYNQRGVRFALTESGHVAQNALLAAVALGLSALPIGGYFDEEHVKTADNKVTTAQIKTEKAN